MSGEVVTPFNALKLLRHADRIEKMLDGQRVAPVTVEWDLSNTCPHDCLWCSFGTSESQGYRQQNWVQFPTARAITLLEELAAAGVKGICYTGGGEPLVHRAAALIFEKTTQVGIDWGVVTNGLGLAGMARSVIASHAKFVRVSLDAGTPETHMRTHNITGPQLTQIIENLHQTRIKAGDRPLTIGASFCVQEANYKEIYAAAKLVKDAGGDYLEVRPVYPTDWRGDGWTLQADHVEAAKVELAHAQMHLDGNGFRVIGMIERFDSLTKPEKGYATCHIGPLTTVIGADGRGWHCCVMRGQDAFSWGSVLTEAFEAAWLTPAHHALIDGIDVSQCPRCRYDSLNRVIDQAVIHDGMHRNFI